MLSGAAAHKGAQSMDLKSYFEKNMGVGILSTADSRGQVDAAVYSRPHVMEDGSIAFIMRDRLTHHNLKSNPYAAYLFKENGNGYRGKRLFLTKLWEEEESETLYLLRRKSYPDKRDRRETKFLVYFKVDQILPLIGPGRQPQDN
jgi:hypothetical protein